MNVCTTLTAPTYAPQDFKSGVKPVWCPGCGDYAVLSAMTKAFSDMELAPHEVAVVSGIGCSSRIPAYTTCYGFHGVHGRALTAGTGLKLARPDLTVVVAGGDGDGFSIGGNHFLHACRRNVDITYVVMDNRVYGMTKGQPSPTTEPDWDHSEMAPPGGTGMTPFNALAIALSAGANYIARTFSGDIAGTAATIIEAIRHPGFSFVVVMSPCITFREETRAWKTAVRKNAVQPTSDIKEATQLLMNDDGLNMGVLFKGNRPPHPMGRRPVATVAELDAQFAI